MTVAIEHVQHRIARDSHPRDARLAQTRCGRLVLPAHSPGPTTHEPATSRCARCFA